MMPQTVAYGVDFYLQASIATQTMDEHAHTYPAVFTHTTIGPTKQDHLLTFRICRSRTDTFQQEIW